MAVFLVAAVVAYFRLGRVPLRGVMWAEDGTIFLAEAHRTGLWTAALRPYNGYALLEPRIMAELVSWAPLGWQGHLMSVAAVACQAAVALLAFHVVRAHAQTRVPPLLTALVVAAVPVGFEVVNNVANSQWFLLAGACLAALWNPAHLTGRVVSATVLFLAVLTCPFAGVAVALVFGLWLLDRDRAQLALLLSGVAGLAIQVWVAAHAPPRTVPVDPRFEAGNLSAGYLRRVVGDGLLGSPRHDGQPSPGLLLGAVVLVLLVSVLAVLAARERRSRLGAPLVLIGTSIVLFAAPVYLTHPDTSQTYSEGRYYVAPVILFMTALFLVGEEAWLARRARGGTILATLALVAAAVSVVGLAISWRVPDFDARYSGPGWKDELARAQQRCEKHPRQPAQLSISPPGWTVTLSCSEVSGD